ncbi:MAG: 2-hydroxyacid dehydrogenase [Rhodospirillaceae bacterium]|jgi:hydroxypyruvate reductase|nr:2-hydroxyacid dehydrogenase [Rhodospirillaceae bacterium]MBT5898283.1 2-hydroxyacid dehydrogenase [Rhodospirillaceae bacterium]MBT6430374.1 2-hydroxyacid dehydrogenase [Rhodospirillaceae bacterium]MBT7760872.1 2-hydroxyacid dehydrogenase [Rhodospirillaceae bacterium]
MRRDGDSEKPCVLLIDPIPSWIVDRAREEFDLIVLGHESERSPLFTENLDRIRGIAMPGFAKVDAAMMQLLPNLEIVACFGVGYDGADTTYAAANNIAVTNTPEVLTDCVADLGMALILATLRKVVVGDRYVRAGRWTKEGFMDLTDSPRGRRLGIVGLGRIGLELANRAEAFGMSIVYYNRTERDDVSYPYYENAVALAEACDVLALTCPGGEATRNLIGAEVLAALGPKGYLINIARGTVVDEAALVTAISEHIIAGAGLDVFADEPNVPEALFPFEQVVLQPHQASATIETRTAMGNLTIDNLRAQFAGQPLPNQVA